MPIGHFGRHFQPCSSSQDRDHQVALRLYLQDLYSMLPPGLQQLASRVVRGDSRPSTSRVSNVSSDGGKFSATIDVQNFKPEEISVRVTGNTIIVEGKHEEREDENGSISRHFVRKFNVPREFDVNKVQSSLSTDEILHVTAPRIASEEGEGGIVIPVVHIGQSSETGENKGKE